MQREPFQILELIESEQGIATVYDRFEKGGDSREKHFESVLNKELRRLVASTEGLPIIISGMASSAIGWRELPYAPLPQRFADPLASKRVGIDRDVRLISGLRWKTHDVMRGEESQVVGLWANPSLALPARFRVVLPGTHCKHVLVEDESITEFETFLTGDLFQALGKSSILKHSVDMGIEVVADEAFEEGVLRSRDGAMDRELFGIRCSDLFGERNVAANTAFLSGLLIGSEMRALASGVDPVVIAESPLGTLYASALRALGGRDRLVFISRAALDESVARAHARLFGSSSQSCSQSGN